MHIQVKLFALARDLAGQSEISLEVNEGATVSDVRIALLERCPKLQPSIESMTFAVDTQYADAATPVTASSEVAVIPPVSGG